MIDSALYHRLAPVVRRIQIRRVFTTLASVWVSATIIGLVLWGMKSSGSFHSPWTVPCLLLGTLVASLTGIWCALRDDNGFKQTVRDIEEQYPELDSSLVTAIEQQPTQAHGTLGYLQQEVVRKAVYHGYQNSWSRIVPQWQLLMLPILAGLGLLAFMAAITGNVFTPAPSMADTVTERVVSEDAGTVLASGFEIEPGDVELERLSSLMVLARFAPDMVPGNAELVFWDEQNQETRLAMNKSLDDPLFGARIGSIKGPLQYAVQFDGQQSEKFKVSVFEFPKLVRADAELKFPGFTGQPDKLVQDVRRVSAVGGTSVTWKLLLNKAVESGRLLGRDGTELRLLPDPAQPGQYLVTMELHKSGKYELQLTDSEGRSNREAPVLSIQVAGNQPVEIRQLAPAADVEVSPVEELDIAATFWDDFGVKRAGMTFAKGGGKPTTIELASDIPAKTKTEINHVVSFEDLGTIPNDLVTFYFWAEDQAADGSLRKTMGDMYLVTVREFESIFRQGQQQPAGGQQGGGGGQGDQQQGMELLELQREIVYAIWNLQRREIFADRTSGFNDDVQVISDSQTEGLAMLDEMAGQITDAMLKPVVDIVRQHQESTVEYLKESASSESLDPLQGALVSAQAAYSALLQFRNSESNVVQNQSQQQGGGGGGNSQRQQMQQLELENDENRYASEQTASERNESPEQREDRQVLSRLRELARRQNDLNKRMKELQAALDAAETEQERQDAQEQLKRLRDEQQQIIRDTEELQERMEQPDNQSRMSEQAEQLEEARENARQASESLEQGEPGQATAQGTRALRDMEELRDEFQNRSSGQFDQQMQQMRNEARDIEKEQQEIAKELDEVDAERPESKRSLTDDSDQAGLEDRLESQRDRVESLREEMRNVIEESEEYEPLLAEKLYDTYRRTQQQSAEQALDSTARSLRQGLMDDARTEQRRAASAIENLREGIDEAAESVLGDETEALRRANRELQRLSNAVQGEMERSASTEEGDESPGTSSSEQPERDSEANQNGQGNSRRQGNGRQEDPDSEQRDSDRRPAQQEQTEGQDGSSPSGRDDEQPGQSDQPGQEGGGGEGNQNRPDDLPTETPSMRQGGSSDPQQPRDSNGRIGAAPDINYDEETWQDPITGGDFSEWSDRMRDVEEMVADPELRSEAARIRENARSIRRDIKRHAKKPNWEMIKTKVLEPLVVLQDRVHEELIRRNGDKSMVPVDRDPVPAEFEEAVQKYFEQLGSGQ